MLNYIDESTLTRLGRCPRALEALRLAKHSLPEPIVASSIAAQLGVRPSSMSRIFSAKVGRSFKAIVQVLRIEMAVAELKERDCGLAHLARVTGYGSARTFSRSFKRIVGVRPSEFRRKVLYPG
jgi:two-component system response regulator YesN